MRIAIIGAGPAGTTAALLLGDAGHDVVLVDRDAGPGPDGTWERTGVMQFHLPHTFRALGRLVLERRLPGVHQALLDAGGLLSVPDGAPEFMADLHLRREVFEQVLWEAASRHPQVRRHLGHAEDVRIEHGAVTGVVVDGAVVGAELVVDATGRSGRFAAAHQPPAESVGCGQAYAARRYRLLAGAEPGPLNGGPGYVAEHDGFASLVFTHDAGYFTVLLVRAAHDDALAAVREEALFERAVAAVPGVGRWTEATRSVPVDRVRVGAGLANRYRPQARDLVGLLTIGDAACTTNPVAARGVSFALMAAEALGQVVADHEPAEWAETLDAWAATQLQPWYRDHLVMDEVTQRRWAHQPLDPDGPISWPLLLAALEQRPDFLPVLGPFLGMVAPPASVDPLREEVRTMLREGWVPPAPPAPTRDDLVALLAAAEPLVPAG